MNWSTCEFLESADEMEASQGCQGRLLAQPKAKPALSYLVSLYLQPYLFITIMILEESMLKYPPGFFGEEDHIEDR